MNNKLMRSGLCQYVVLEAEQFQEESKACEKQRPISWACPMSSAGEFGPVHGAEFKGSAR